MEENQFKIEIIEIPDSPLPQEFKIEESEQELGINDDLTSLFTKEEYVVATDMGGFYRVPADKRDLNYDKFFIIKSS